MSDATGATKRGMVASRRMPVNTAGTGRPSAPHRACRARAGRRGAVRSGRLGLLIAVAGVGAVACSRAPDAELVEQFRLACTHLATAAATDGKDVVTGSDGWYFAPEEVAALGAEVDDEPYAAGGAIAAASDRLRAAGMELLLVPVPPKSIIYPDRLAPELDVPIPIPRLDTRLQAIYADLRQRGVRLVDLTRPFIRDRFHHEGPLFCRQDSHWSGVGCVLGAELVAAAVREVGGIALEPLTAYGLAWFTTPIRGDLWQRLAARPVPEEIRMRGVIRPADAGLATVTTTGGSPLAVVGDTHALVFHAGDPYHARGAGLADQLAFEFQRPVALVAHEADVPAAGDWSLPALPDGTRVAIWVLSATRLLR